VPHAPKHEDRFHRTSRYGAGGVLTGERGGAAAAALAAAAELEPEEGVCVCVCVCGWGVGGWGGGWGLRGPGVLAVLPFLMWC
jgi:hypothetical protein